MLVSECYGGGMYITNPNLNQNHRHILRQPPTVHYHRNPRPKVQTNSKSILKHRIIHLFRLQNWLSHQHCRIQSPMPTPLQDLYIWYLSCLVSFLLPGCHNIYLNILSTITKEMLLSMPRWILLRHANARMLTVQSSVQNLLDLPNKLPNLLQRCHSKVPQ